MKAQVFSSVSFETKKHKIRPFHSNVDFSSMISKKCDFLEEAYSLFKNIFLIYSNNDLINFFDTGFKFFFCYFHLFNVLCLMFNVLLL